MTLHVAIVKAEGELVNVSVKMFDADLMIDAVNAALQDRPYRFDTVGADLASHIFARAVIHGVVLEASRVHVFVCAVVIGIERRAGRYVVLTKLREIHAQLKKLEPLMENIA